MRREELLESIVVLDLISITRWVYGWEIHGLPQNVVVKHNKRLVSFRLTETIQEYVCRSATDCVSPNCQCIPNVVWLWPVNYAPTTFNLSHLLATKYLGALQACGRVGHAYKIRLSLQIRLRFLPQNLKISYFPKKAKILLQQLVSRWYNGQ